MSDLATRLTEVLPGNVLTGDQIPRDYLHDEALAAVTVRPAAVVRPGNAAELAAVLVIAADPGVPVTARGSGTGVSGGYVPVEDGIVVSSG